MYAMPVIISSPSAIDLRASRDRPSGKFTTIETNFIKIKIWYDFTHDRFYRSIIPSYFLKHKGDDSVVLQFHQNGHVVEDVVGLEAVKSAVSFNKRRYFWRSLNFFLMFYIHS